MRTGEAQLLPEIPDELLVEAAHDAEHLAAIRALEHPLRHERADDHRRAACSA